MSIPNAELTQVSEENAGHTALLIIPDVNLSKHQAVSLMTHSYSEFKIYVHTGELPTFTQVESFAESLHQTLEKKGVKRVTVFGICRGASVAQSMAILASRMVRRIVLLDATTRLAPGFLDRTIDKIERFLPLGLPLRRLSNAFDSRPFLHRIHCPSLVLISPSAGLFVRRQSQFIAEKIPNAWLQTLEQPYVNYPNRDGSNRNSSEGRGDAELSDELQHLLHNFLQVPVKRPQKNL